MIDLFDIEELQSSELAPPFNFTKGAPNAQDEARSQETHKLARTATLWKIARPRFTTLRRTLGKKIRLPIPQSRRVLRPKLHITSRDMTPPPELFTHFDLVQPDIALAGE